MWYVYIIECRDKTLYTGVTNDIPRRVKRHNAKDGCAYTRTRTPVKLVYQEPCPSYSSALKREAQIILRQAQDNPEQVKRAEGSSAGLALRN
jgi:putative endonuclease